MFKSSSQLKLMQNDNDLLIHPIQAPPYGSKSSFEVELVPQAAAPPDSFPSNSPSDGGKISPIVLLMIVILAAIFFISGCLHLLFRYLMKRPPSRSLFQSNRYNFSTTDQASTSHVLQRQLQQLFRLHDSGLDQSYIDNLPVFYYKDVLMGLNLKQQFDCAVCLSEFSNQDKLKLLPLCSHAFHINCIDPWLMSNSTCPLCRGTLLNPSLPSLTHMTGSSDDSIGLSLSTASENSSSNSNSITMDDKRVYSIRLGNFRTSNSQEADHKNDSENNSSTSKLDARRCYSMGSYQYVVTHDSYLKVALDLKLGKVKGVDGDCVSIGGGEVVCKKIGSSLKGGDSFSVSKIWLWSKKRKFEDHHHHHHHHDSRMAGLGLNIV